MKLFQRRWRLSPWKTRLQQVDPVRKAGVVTLALMLSAAPTMACLLPWATLTSAEHECCKQMAGQCGKAGMPSSHSCCQRLAGPDGTFVEAQSPQMGNELAGVAVHLVPATIRPLAVLSNHFAKFDWFDGLHGPPESPPASATVLRI